MFDGTRLGCSCSGRWRSPTRRDREWAAVRGDARASFPKRQVISLPFCRIKQDAFGFLEKQNLPLCFMSRFNGWRIVGTPTPQSIGLLQFFANEFAGGRR